MCDLKFCAITRNLLLSNDNIVINKNKTHCRDQSSHHHDQHPLLLKSLFEGSVFKEIKKK